MIIKNSLILSLKEILGFETERTAAIKIEWQRRLDNELGKGKLGLANGSLKELLYLAKPTNRKYRTYCMTFVTNDRNSTWVVKSVFKTSGNYMDEGYSNVYGFIRADKNLEDGTPIVQFYVGTYLQDSDALVLTKGTIIDAVKLLGS